MRIYLSVILCINKLFNSIQLTDGWMDGYTYIYKLIYIYIYIHIYIYIKYNIYKYINYILNLYYNLL